MTEKVIKMIDELRGLERLTEDTGAGPALMLDNPQNDSEACAQVIAKFKLACTALHTYETYVPALLKEWDIFVAVRNALSGTVEVTDEVLEKLSDREELKKWIGRSAWYSKKVDFLEKAYARLQSELDQERGRVAGMEEGADVMRRELAAIRERAEAAERLLVTAHEIIGACLAYFNQSEIVKQGLTEHFLTKLTKFASHGQQAMEAEVQ